CHPSSSSCCCRGLKVNTNSNLLTVLGLSRRFRESSLSELFGQIALRYRTRSASTTPNGAAAG
ncbi:hypothetical protein, partial [Cupriavidus sp. CuC1]|uniref:hypothetical protein n=1 Tax=Cupriavidus sp. CuC1 TaxID=3373131 RepID=UPI0037D6DAE8